MWCVPEEVKEATWEQNSDFYKDLKLNFTVSEFDCEQKAEVYCKEANCNVNNSDKKTSNFLSQYFIQTHQGINFKLLFHKSNTIH